MILLSIDRFDSITEKWHEMPAMLEKRKYLSLVAFNNTIFAIGGVNGDDVRLKSVEYYHR